MDLTDKKKKKHAYSRNSTESIDTKFKLWGKGLPWDTMSAWTCHARYTIFTL